MKFLLPLLLAVGCVPTTIEPGFRGVEVAYGTANPELLQPGMHWVRVDYGVTEVSVQEKAFEITGSGFTIDNQEVDFTMTVVTQLTEEGVFDLVTSHPNFFRDALVPISIDSAKEAAKRRDIWEVNTSRELVAADTQEILQTAVEPYGLTIVSIQFTNMEPDSEFMASVRQRQQAEVETSKAAEELARKTTEAQIVIAEAEAAASALRLTADAEAYSIQTTGEMLRRYPQVLDAQRIETWNGSMPSTLITDGGNSTLLIGSGGN